MNHIDIAVVAIITLSTLVGFARGGLSSILSTLGWIVALIVNHYLFNSIEAFLEARFDSKILTFIVGYIGGLFIILFLVSIVNFLILSMLTQFRGSFIDKVFGIIFGGIRGLLIIAMVFLCFEIGMQALSGENSTVKDYPKILLDAATLPFMKRLEAELMQYVPEHFKESLSAFKSKSEEKVSDILILNIIRKLSDGIPKDELDKINKSVEENSNYQSHRQILIAKVKALVEFRQKNKMSDLPKENLRVIQLITSSDVREKP
jgi:membrane protein required for colicin V production